MGGRMGGKNEIDILNLGADPHGMSDSGPAIRQAIQSCADRGGGTVTVPAGTYLTGPIVLLSRVYLKCTPGSVLRFSFNAEDYPLVFTRWEGTECYALSPMVFADGQSDCGIIGGGVIDGQGGYWWEEYRKIRSGQESVFHRKIAETLERNAEIDYSASGGGGLSTGFLRPPLVQFKHCRRVKISGVTLQNSPFWNTHILYCDDVSIRDCHFSNPPDAPNTDGLNIDSSRNVGIEDCTFDVGDDCLGLKSGMNADGRRVNQPTENVKIHGCTMRRGHGGIVFGSEMAGGVRNVRVSDCRFSGTDRGIRIKSRRGRGGYVEDVQVENIQMENVMTCIVINLFYRCGSEALDRDELKRVSDPGYVPVDDATPKVRSIRISGVKASEVQTAAGVFFGLPEEPIRGLHLSGLDIRMASPGRQDTPAMDFNSTVCLRTGFLGSNLESPGFSDIRVSGADPPVFRIETSDRRR